MSARPTFVVVAPPPTSNGDLHVGHLAGPYLGADVFTRFHRLCGRRVVAALSTDDNQSYVVTTAERLGVDALELAVASHREISATLDEALISFDVIGRPDSDYLEFVTSFLARLREAGAFVEQEIALYYDSGRGRHLLESYVGGRCPVCFSDTRGNICEACGHPNDPFRLVRPYAAGGSGERQLETRTAFALFLPLERYRSRIERYYADRQAQLRPGLRTLVRSLLEAELPDFPMTHVSSWGIPVKVRGDQASVYNVWAEMYPGHLYWARRAHLATAGDGVPGELWGAGGDVRYVQFLGFDNSFFYAVAHLAMAMAAEDAGLPALMPSQLVTNEFYLLDNHKFSTSQGHLMWGRDLLSRYEVDAVRFYLCLSNPETQQTNFVLRDMETLLEEQLIQPWEQLCGDWSILASSGRLDGEAAGAWPRWQDAFRRRFELAYDPATFSLQLAAVTLRSYIQFLASELRRAVALGAGATDCDGFGTALGGLALFAAPLMPRFATRLAERLGIRELSWTRPPVPDLRGRGELTADLLPLRRRREVAVLGGDGTRPRGSAGGRRGLATGSGGR